MSPSGPKGSIGLKICGITRSEDLLACARLGVDAVGFNLWPGSRRHCTVEQAKVMLELLERSHEHRPLRVGVLVDAAVGEVDDAITELRLDLIQPHGDAPVEPYAELADRRGIGWIWVVRGTPSLDDLTIPTPRPRWALLDALVPGFGGAGQTTDWDWAARAVQRLADAGLPAWLAGGISARNAAEALARVGPAGLDVASGAEQIGATHGEKSTEAIAALRAICNK